MQIKESYPELWAAVNEIPTNLVIPRNNGIYLQRALYLGLKKRGPKYLDWLLAQDKIEISHKAMTILEIVCIYQRFLTWDRLLAYLRDHNWGEMEPDTSETPTEPEKRLEDRDLAWLNSDERKRALERTTDR